MIDSDESKLNKESLSALLDNEADDLELRRLLRSLQSGTEADTDELLQTWGRYHLVRDTLHNQGAIVSNDLSRRIRAQLQSEPVPAGKALPSWQQNLVKLAIAASVAAVFMVTLQTGLERPAGSAPVTDQANQVNHPADASTPEGSAVEAPAPTLVAGSEAELEPVQLDPVAQQRLHDYLSAMTLDASELPPMEHLIQDSPLYRLVNELQDLP